MYTAFLTSILSAFSLFLHSLSLLSRSLFPFLSQCHHKFHNYQQIFKALFLTSTPDSILQRSPLLKGAHAAPTRACMYKPEANHIFMYIFMSRCSMLMRRSVCRTLFAQCSVILLVLFHINVVSSADPPPVPIADILLKFKESLKISGTALSDWVKTTPPCGVGKKSNWDGVVCDRGKVTGLKLHNKGLSGSMDLTPLAQLPNLTSMTLAENEFEGPFPDVKKVPMMKALYFEKNKFSGEIPSNWFEGMKDLKKLNLNGNQFTGPIPKSLTTLAKMTELYLNGNKFSGKIPEFPQTRLKVFDVAKNQLEGEIPNNFRTMNASYFADNKDLCGAPIHACPAPSKNVSTEKPKGVSTTLIAVMILIAVISLCAVIFFVIVRRRNKKAQLSSPNNIEAPPVAPVQQGRAVSPAPQQQESDTASVTSEKSSKGSGKKGDSLKLSFVRDDRERFDMQDLLKASAEVLGGSGSFGSSYMTALLTGPVMVVKRYKQMNCAGKEEFQEHMRRLGRLGHPNLLPLVAYYYKKEEKLLITDHVANGSLAIHLHGNQSLGKPSLDWPKRLKIVKGVAQGLKYLYSELPNITAPHGHLKSSNVLLNDSFEPLVTDYGLLPVVNQEHAQTLMVAYKSPEYVATKQITKKTDVWSLGVLILEILTGKLPTNFLQHGKGSEEDLASWVNSVPREEWFTQVFGREMGANKNSEGEMLKLLNIGLDCCEGDEEKRWDLKEAVEKIEELKEKDDSGGAPEEEVFSPCEDGDTTKME